MSLQINLNATGNVKGVIRRGFLTKIQFLNSFGRSKPIVRADRRINEGLLCSFDRWKRLELARASCHVKRGIDIGRGWVLAARVINHGLSLIPLPRNQYDDNRATSLVLFPEFPMILAEPYTTVYLGQWSNEVRARGTLVEVRNIARLALRQLAFEMGIDTCIYTGCFF